MGFSSTVVEAALKQALGNMEVALDLCCTGFEPVGQSMSDEVKLNAEVDRDGHRGISASSEWRMVRRPVAADNSCLFTALALLFYNTREKASAQALRAIVAAAVSAPGAAFSAAQLDGKVTIP